MTVIREGQEGSIKPDINEVVVIEKEPDIIIAGDSTNGVGAVFQATKGDLNTIYISDSLQTWVSQFGDYLEGLDGYLFAKKFFDANGGVLHGVRVASSGTAKASVSITGTASTGTTLTWNYPSVGTAGNNAIVTVSNASITGYVNIRIQDGTKSTEYIQVTTDITDSQYLLTLVNRDPNKILDVVMSVTDGTLPATGTYNLSGGSNGAITGSALADSFYVGVETSSGRTGYQVFKETDEIIEVVSDRTSSTVNAGLVAHVNDLSLSPRRAVISFDAGTSVESARTLMDSYNDDKVQVIYPQVYVTNPFTGLSELTSATAFKAGLNSVLSYHLSCSQRALPSSVTKVEFNLTNNDIQRLAEKRISPIRKVRGLGIIYEKDITTSALKAKSQWAIRRAKDFFALSFEDGLRPFISKNITATLLLNISTALKTFLGLEARAGKIGRLDGSQPYGVGMSRNTSDTAKLGQVLIDTEVSLLGFADKIYVYFDADIEKTIVNTN
jgi:phage tail sheath protein FI